MGFSIPSNWCYYLLFDVKFIWSFFRDNLNNLVWSNEGQSKTRLQWWLNFAIINCFVTMWISFWRWWYTGLQQSLTSMKIYFLYSQKMMTTMKTKIFSFQNLAHFSIVSFIFLGLNLIIKIIKKKKFMRQTDNYISSMKIRDLYPARIK